MNDHEPLLTALEELTGRFRRVYGLKTGCYFNDDEVEIFINEKIVTFDRKDGHIIDAGTSFIEDEPTNDYDTLRDNLERFIEADQRIRLAEKGSDATEFEGIRRFRGVFLCEGISALDPSVDNLPTTEYESIVKHLEDLGVMLHERTNTIFTQSAKLTEMWQRDPDELIAYLEKTKEEMDI